MLDDEMLKTLASLTGLSTLAAASRTMLSEDRRTFTGYIRAIILALFVGSITGLLIQDYNLSAATEGGIVGVAAFIADDILIFIVRVAKMLSDNPRIIIDVLFRKKQ